MYKFNTEQNMLSHLEEKKSITIIPTKKIKKK